jgi:hypothetical protein
VGRAWGFIEDGRVSNLVPADYRKNPALIHSLMMAIDSIARKIALRRNTYQDQPIIFLSSNKFKVKRTPNPVISVGMCTKPPLCVPLDRSIWTQRISSFTNRLRNRTARM